MHILVSELDQLQVEFRKFKFSISHYGTFSLISPELLKLYVKKMSRKVTNVLFLLFYASFFSYYLFNMSLFVLSILH